MWRLSVCLYRISHASSTPQKKSISFLSQNLTHKRVFTKHPEYTPRFLSENIRYISYFDRVSTDFYKSIHRIAVDGFCSINLHFLCISWVVFVDVVLKNTFPRSHPRWSGWPRLFRDNIKLNVFMFMALKSWSTKLISINVKITSCHLARVLRLRY